jgi:hypothetical protein
MLASNPLTASIDIQKAASTFNQLTEVTSKPASKTKFGEFADDILNISTLALEKQQTEAQIQENKKTNDVGNDFIRVSSSIGESRTLGNLTHSQATNLYNKIAALL